jgi:hypothetical protein
MNLLSHDVIDINRNVIAGMAVIHIGLNYVLSRSTFGKNAIEPRARLARKPPTFNFRERAVEHAAMFILISVFLYFMGYEVVVMMTQSGSAVTGGYNIIRAGERISSICQLSQFVLG